MSMTVSNLKRSASINCGAMCPLLSMLHYQILFTPELQQFWIIIKISVFCFHCDELLPVQLFTLHYDKLSYRFEYCR